uniref:Uncharacterized protein n=1 Tax=Candidatus Kentrum sp. TC TaxID=2126339 RepID=A0A450YYJ8_9GAMM|nr:MAG: hypothetical protein BECKTC1821E_GA0114239_106717 [Candidatus Kentron sp. TC]
MTRRGLMYICPFCLHRMRTAHRAPDQWFVERRLEFHHLCERCGRFSIPEMLHRPGKSLDGELFYMFAPCPNAYECECRDVYDASCEGDRVMKKCLHGLYRELEATNHFLQDLIRRIEGLPAPPESQSEPHRKRPGNE